MDDRMGNMTGRRMGRRKREEEKEREEERDGGRKKETEKLADREDGKVRLQAMDKESGINIGEKGKGARDD